MTRVRKGQAPGNLSRASFQKHFRRSYFDPAFDGERAALTRLERIAWDAYVDERKAPVTRKAGVQFADPNYELSVEWLETRARLQKAAAKQKKHATRSRVLLICASARNDGSCPGEISKTFRLARAAQATLKSAGIETDLLDLSLLTSEYGRKIYPCKGCVSTAMPLCHWPFSCYPNHALGQADDWMAEIYERWTAVHGILIVTPVYWYQTPSTLKHMMDRLVCADGGNDDPTSTAGKDARAGIEGVRHSLSDWLDWMGLIDAGFQSRLDRMIGYYEPYATSHAALDRDLPLQEEVRNVARALANAVAELRAGRLSAPGAELKSPRPK